jgi:hypothetical protein
MPLPDRGGLGWRRRESRSSLPHGRRGSIPPPLLPSAVSFRHRPPTLRPSLSSSFCGSTELFYATRVQDLTPRVSYREPRLSHAHTSSAIEYAGGDAYGKAAALCKLETSPWRRQQDGGECAGLANSPDILLRQHSLAPWCVKLNVQ